MLRKFAVAARAVPTDSDALAVHRNLQNIRVFVSRLSGVKLVVMMAFFEGFITRFMACLEELARRQGSAEHEYTKVHGVVDLVHTQQLFRALEAELRLMHAPPPQATQLFEGVELLRALIENIVHPVASEGPTSAREGARRSGDSEADPWRSIPTVTDQCRRAYSLARDAACPYPPRRAPARRAGG
jgi:hypothetical protein